MSELDIVKVAQEEIDIFERPSVDTSKELISEIKRLRALLSAAPTPPSADRPTDPNEIFGHAGNRIRFDYINADGNWDSKIISHDEMRERYANLMNTKKLMQPDSAAVEPIGTLTRIDAGFPPLGVKSAYKIKLRAGDYAHGSMGKEQYLLCRDRFIADGCENLEKAYSWKETILVGEMKAMEKDLFFRRFAMITKGDF